MNTKVHLSLTVTTPEGVQTFQATADIPDAHPFDVVTVTAEKALGDVHRHYCPMSNIGHEPRAGDALTPKK